MDLFVFTTAEGYDIAIPEDDIATIWAAKTPGHILIERITDRPDLEVVYDFNKFITDYADHIDLRSRARKPNKRTAPKATDTPKGNVIALEKSRGKK